MERPIIFAMTYLFFWVSLAVAVGMFAGSRGRNGFGWFVLSMLISPLLGFIFCAVSSNLKAGAALKLEKEAIPSDKTHLRCPKCAEFVLPQATICKHCSAALTPDDQFKARQSQIAADADSEELSNTLIGWSILCGLGFLIWLYAHYK
jgi:hypothetical protein